MILIADTEKFVRQCLRVGENLGESGETFILDEEAKPLTPLKYPLPGGKSAELLTFRLPTNAARLASSGNEGMTLDRDYRGKRILAAYRHLRLSSQWGWGLIVKIDSYELFAPLRTEIVNTIWIVLITTGLVQTLSRPILALSKVASRLAEGDFSVRARLKRRDEIGTLGAAFDFMAGKIQAAFESLEKEVGDRRRAEEELRQHRDHLEQIVAARTVELRESEKRFRGLFENSPVSIWEADFSAVKASLDTLKEQGVENLGE